MITTLKGFSKFLEKKEIYTDLVICDIQKEFNKFFNNTYLLEVKKFAEKINRVHQIYDTINADTYSYYFPNQVNEYEKQYGGELLEEDIEIYFRDNIIIEELQNKFNTGFEQGDKFKTATNDYWVYIDGKHEWFYCPSDLAVLFEKMSDNNRKVCLIGGGIDECLLDIYVTMVSFNVDVKYNNDLCYSYKGTKFIEKHGDIELDKYLNEIEYDEIDENKLIQVYDEIPDDMEIDQIIDVFSDFEEIKESHGNNLSTTNLVNKQVDRNDILWITCMLKPRNKSGAYPLGEIGVIKVKVLQTFYGLDKLKQLKKSDKIL